MTLEVTCVTLIIGVAKLGGDHMQSFDSDVHNQPGQISKCSGIPGTRGFHLGMGTQVGQMPFLSGGKMRPDTCLIQLSSMQCLGDLLGMVFEMVFLDYSVCPAPLLGNTSQ